MNRTEDGRFHDKRVKISKNLLNKILLESKLEKRLSWKEFAKKLGVSTSTIRYDWRKKGTTIPLKLFKKILNMHPSLNWKEVTGKLDILDPYWGQKIGKKSKFEGEIKIPMVNSKEFAEFYGALLGDGCVYSNLSGFCISGNSILDKNYLEKYISTLIQKLFGIKPKIYFSLNQGKIVRCVVYSKEIVKFLIRTGFSAGNKNNKNTKIPAIFFKDKELLKACIRGIFDTDGSIYPQRNSKILLDISIKINSLLTSTIRAFKSINFRVNNTNNRVYLCGPRPIAQFIVDLGSSNLRHIIKYYTYIKKGYVPKTEETEMFLKQKTLPKLDLPYHGPVV